MGKVASFFYKVNTYLQKSITCIGLQADRSNVLSKYIIYMFFNFGRGFAVPFLCYFQKLQLLVVKKLLLFAPNIHGLKIFKISFQTGDINIFVLCSVFFSRYVKLKSFFSEKKMSVVKSETHYGREALEKTTLKSLMAMCF